MRSSAAFFRSADSARARLLTRRAALAFKRAGGAARRKFPVGEQIMTQWPRHGRIDGAIVMIGFGSIGKGTLPLIERHFDFDKRHFVVIGPDDTDRRLLDERGIKFVHLAITRDNYREVLTRYLTAGAGQGFCVNLSVDTSSLAIMEHCREIGALYIDTVVEPWPGFYFDKNISPDARSNYALREP